MSRGIVLPFHDLGAEDGGGWSAQRPGRFTPGERPGTHCTGGWVGPRTGLDGCRKSRRHRDSIPGPSSPQRVATPAELSRPIRCQESTGRYRKEDGMAKVIIFQRSDFLIAFGFDFKPCLLTFRRILISVFSDTVDSA